MVTSRHLTLAAVLAAVLLAFSPAYAGVYDVDNAHTYVGFAVKHMVIAKVKGSFGDFTASFELGDGHVLKSATADINVKSIDTGIEKRDNDLRSENFFYADKYPLLTFRSAKAERGADGKYSVTGDITIRGVTRAITLTGEVVGPVADPWGNERMGFNASGKLDRKDFGLMWNMALETGGFLVGDEVELVIEGEGVLRK